MPWWSFHFIVLEENICGLINISVINITIIIVVIIFAVVNVDHYESYCSK